MAVSNEYILDVDLKHLFTFTNPKFARGDSATLIFRVFDDGMEYERMQYITKAELYHRTPSGTNIKSNCEIITLNGKKVIKYNYEQIVMVELGYIRTQLVLYEGDTKVSIQPINVLIFDDLKGGAGSYLELIQDLMNIIEDLVLDLNNTIKLEEKGVAGGVATLDDAGKIPLRQMPDVINSYLEHIQHTVFKDQVHGMRVNEDGWLQYETTSNNWQNVEFSPDAVSGGGSGQFLNAMVNVKDGIATVTYYGIPTVSAQKWTFGDQNLGYFDLSGNTFAGLTFPVTQAGLYTLWYRDSNGTKYTRVFNVDMSDLNQPSIEVDIVDGIVTVDINKPVSIKKWAKGQQVLSYFASGGTVFTGNSFSISESGWYTVYVKTTDGVESIYSFEVTPDMLQQPEITVSVNNGVATVSYTPNYTISVRKWSSGSQESTYFNNNGTAYTDDSFNINSIGEHTVYHKYSNGLEAIKVFDVTQSMLPIVDITPPILTLTQSQISPSLIRITANAVDNESGMKSITKPNNIEVNGSTTTHDVTANGTYTFLATDVAGNIGFKNITISTIDSNPPTINLTYSPTSLTSGAVTITANIDDVGSGVNIKKWADGDKDASYFSVNGTVLNSASFSVSSNGIYSVYAIDHAGNTMVRTIEINNINTVAPTINLSQSPTTWTSTPVNITATINSYSGTINERKWASGSQAISYFATSGTSFTGNSISISTNGIYTVYAKDGLGNESIKTITISNIDSSVPTITLSQASSGTNKIITVTASDSESGIQSITLPDGTTYNGTSTQYTAYSNGTYEFIARNNAGLSTTKSIAVTGIVVNTDVQYIHGGSNTFKITTSGEVYGQGTNDQGQLGVGYSSYDTSLNTPIKANILGVTQVVPSDSGTFFLMKSGEIYYSGKASFNFPLTSNTYSTPTKISNISDAKQMVTNEYGDVLFYQTSNGDWYAFGLNRNGQLGLGYVTTTNDGRLTSPVKITTFTSSIIDITTQLETSIFVLSDGRVFYSGNINLPLSTNNTTVTTPQQITGFPSSKPIKATLDHQATNVFFILNDTSRQVMGLGYNESYELGLGHTMVIGDTPIYINGFGGVSKIECGAGFALALRTDGKVMTTGIANASGVVGTSDGTVNFAKTPTEVLFSGTAKDISTSDSASLIHTTLNRVYGAGDAGYNAFANNNTNITGQTVRLTNIE